MNAILTKLLCYVMATGAAAMTCACGTAKREAAQKNPAQAATLPVPAVTAGRGHIIGSEERIAGKAVSNTPKGVVYRMSGDYSDNVPVTLGADGSLVSYPAPTDIRDGSRPLPLADGWWLDRRGVTSSTVFTRYTYAGYASLKQAPEPAALLDAVIPGARVTVVRQLPMTTQEAVADTAAVNRWLAAQRLGQ